MHMHGARRVYSCAAALQGAGGRSMGAYRPPPDMRTLMDQICSPEWYARMALPANLETLKVG